MSSPTPVDKQCPACLYSLTTTKNLCPRCGDKLSIANAEPVTPPVVLPAAHFFEKPTAPRRVNRTAVLTPPAPPSPITPPPTDKAWLHATPGDNSVHIHSFATYDTAEQLPLPRRGNKPLLLFKVLMLVSLLAVLAAFLVPRVTELLDKDMVDYTGTGDLYPYTFDTANGSCRLVLGAEWRLTDQGKLCRLSHRSLDANIDCGYLTPTDELPDAEALATNERADYNERYADDKGSVSSLLAVRVAGYNGFSFSVHRQEDDDSYRIYFLQADNEVLHFKCKVGKGIDQTARTAVEQALNTLSYTDNSSGG